MVIGRLVVVKLTVVKLVRSQVGGSQAGGSQVGGSQAGGSQARLICRAMRVMERESERQTTLIDIHRTYKSEPTKVVPKGPQAAHFASCLEVPVV